MVALALDERQIAHDAIGVFAGQVERFGEGMSALAQAAMEYVMQHGPIAVSGGSRAAPASQAVSLSAEWSSPELLNVHVFITPGFHINGPDAAEGLVATRLTVSGADGEIDYPPATKKTFPFADEPINIYDGRITINVRFGAAARQKPVMLTLQCQPCNETSCLAAITIHLEVK
jgi:hypothetical protein